jgi:hypothetical protein
MIDCGDFVDIGAVVLRLGVVNWHVLSLKGKHETKTKKRCLFRGTTKKTLLLYII